MIKKTEPRKKKLTLDDFATLIQTDLAAIRKEMATKEEVAALRTDIAGLKNSVREIREDVRNMNDIMVSKADLAETLRDELAKSEYAREVAELRIRVERLEDELGIKRIRRAA